MVRGAAAVARQAIGWVRIAGSSWPALVNGSPGFVALRDGRRPESGGLKAVA
ncbi:hypothetical protein [Nonomuraea sp. NPDC049158]|uniref:hypothetical protein n=1 Tax=Nonomuraea sp. NPDC049158 TaxID=3155649 RepID=UPI0033C876E7